MSACGGSGELVLDLRAAMFARLGLKAMAVAKTAGEFEAERMPNGCAKLEAEYWVDGFGSGKPQSQAGPRRSLSEATRWMTKAASQAAAAMKAKTNKPL